MTITIPTDWTQITLEQFESVLEYVWNWERTVYPDAIAYWYPDKVVKFAYQCDDGRIFVLPDLWQSVEGGAK